MKTTMIEPWLIPPLDGWDICGMNHFYINGNKFLFVSMTKNGFCIKEEGDDDSFLWNRLYHKALELQEEIKK